MIYLALVLSILAILWNSANLIFEVGNRGVSVLGLLCGIVGCTSSVASLIVGS